MRIKAEMAAVGRMLSNLFRPTGKTVLFLGSDGSGKSTVIEKQRVFFEPFYQETRGIRFRHGIFPKLKGGAFFGMPENPGGDQFAYPDKYIWPGIVYYTLSTWVGNRAINCLRRGDRAVFIDRYYYDFFIHKATKDFMFAHPWLLHFVRKPDLVIYLTADAEIIHQRKPELSLEELMEQDRAILRLIPNIAPVHVIDSSNQTLEQTSRTAFGIIAEALIVGQS
jgi:thymidylate kinase